MMLSPVMTMISLSQGQSTVLVKVNSGQIEEVG